jgi:hypothetical protein
MCASDSTLAGGDPSRQSSSQPSLSEFACRESTCCSFLRASSFLADGEEEGLCISSSKRREVAVMRESGVLAWGLAGGVDVKATERRASAAGKLCSGSRGSVRKSSGRASWCELHMCLHDVGRRAATSPRRLRAAVAASTSPCSAPDCTLAPIVFAFVLGQAIAHSECRETRSCNGQLPDNE